MRVLVLASSFPRWAGDAIASAAYDIALGLASKGHDVHVLAPHTAGAATEERLGPVHVHRFHYAPSVAELLAYGSAVHIQLTLHRHPIRWVLVPPFLGSQFLSMIGIVRRHKIDVVHAHSLLPGLVAALGRPFLRRAVVMTFHGNELSMSKSRFRRWLVRVVTSQADACTANSSATRAILQRLTGKEAIVIPMGVDPDRFSPAADGNAPLIGPTPPSILFVGRFVEMKGVSYLIQAFAKVRKAFPDAKLMLVGQGPEAGKLAHLASSLGLGNAVEFRDWCSHEEVLSYYRSASVFVLPSIVTREGDMEGLGMVLLEAASCGVPLVASNVGGIPDVVIHEHTGLLVPPANADALAQAIMRVLGNAALRRALTDNARSHVMKSFTWDSVVDRFDKLLRTVWNAS